MLAESAAGVVEDVVLDDGGSGSQIYDTVGQVVESDEAGGRG